MMARTRPHRLHARARTAAALSIAMLCAAALAEDQPADGARSVWLFAGGLAAGSSGAELHAGDSLVILVSRQLAGERAREALSPAVSLAASGSKKLTLLARPDSGAGDLLVYGLSDDGGWIALAQFQADGPAVLLTDLPPEAAHEAFQLRLRTEGEGGWEILGARAVDAACSLRLESKPESGVSPELRASFAAGERLTAPTVRFFDRPVPIRLEAPPRTDRLTFDRWVLDGRAQPDGLRVLAFVLGGDSVVEAHFALLGDMNDDGVIDRYDIDALVLAIAHPELYEEFHPHVDRVQRGDLNGDGVLDLADLEPFISLLLSP